jgi:hypothetical protein
VTGNGNRTELDRLLYEGELDADHLYVGGDQLMGTWEVSRYLGVEKSRVARWLDENAKGKDSIAPPHARTKAGPFWKLPQIRAKARAMFRSEQGRVPRTEGELNVWLEGRRAARAQRIAA